MVFVKVQNGAIGKYPYTPSDLYADFPQTSFPASLSQADLSDFGVFLVAEVPAPVVDYKKVVYEGTPVNVGGWRQVWVVRDATDAEEAAAFASLQAEYEAAVQAHLDATARTRGYDNMLSACSYASGTHPKFSVEGKDCLAWRAAVWESAYQILTDVKSGVRSLPAIDEVIAELPPMVWSV